MMAPIMGAVSVSNVSELCTEEDRAVTALAPSALRRGRQLLQWVRRYAENQACWFPLGQTYSPDDRYRGFYAEVPIDGEKVPVMAAVQDLFFDAPRLGEGESAAERAADALLYQRQVREFALKYYLRATEQRRQSPAPDGHSPDLPGPLGMLSWAPRPDTRADGFCFAQMYYRRLDGETGKFAAARQADIVDVRKVCGTAEVPREYDWMVLRTRLLDAGLSLPLAGANGPRLLLPMSDVCWLAMGPDFVFDEPPAGPGDAGTYGCGYSMIKYGKTQWPFAYGPGDFDAGIQLNEFRVEADGRTRVRLTFVVSRPRRVLDIFGVDPLFGSISLLNLMTLGAAGRVLDISHDRVSRLILFAHSSMYYAVIAAVLRIFRQTEDWTDPATIPEWIRDKTDA